jgi:hypothetical protein
MLVVASEVSVMLAGWGGTDAATAVVGATSGATILTGEGAALMHAVLGEATSLVDGATT